MAELGEGRERGQGYMLHHSISGSPGGQADSYLFSLPFWTTEWRSVEFLSLQTYVFLLVMLDDPV